MSEDERDLETARALRRYRDAKATEAALTAKAERLAGAFDTVATALRSPMLSHMLIECDNLRMFVPGGVHEAPVSDFDLEQIVRLTSEMKDARETIAKLQPLVKELVG